MGEAYIIRRGGGAAYAIIGVNAPVGSTVTCTKGTVSLIARGGNTDVYFYVPEAGTWHVTASGSGRSVSQDVNITKAGQVEKVTLVYGLALISGGVVQNPSAWTADDMTSQSGSGYVDLIMSHASFEQGIYAIPVDLTEYSKLTIEAYNAGSRELRPNYKWLKAAVKQTADPSEPQTSGEFIDLETVASKTTLELDVSGKTGTWYVGVYGHGLDATVDPGQPTYLDAIARVYNLSLS